MAMKRGGVYSVFIAGSPEDVVGDVTVKYNTIKRENLIGLDKVHGYQENPDVSFISLTVRAQPGRDQNYYWQLTEADVTVNFRDGRQATGQAGWFIDDLEEEVKEGTIKVKFCFQDELLTVTQ
jgi:hypothetical protein